MRRLLFVIFFLPFLLDGCSFFAQPSAIKNRDKHYLAARSVAPMRIPPGISSSDFQNYYPVSERYYPESTKVVSLIPPGLMDK